MSILYDCLWQASMGTVEELKLMIRVHQHREKVEDQISKIKAEARKIRRDLEVVCSHITDVCYTIFLCFDAGYLQPQSLPFDTMSDLPL